MDASCESNLKDYAAKGAEFFKPGIEEKKETSANKRHKSYPRAGEGCFGKERGARLLHLTP